MRKRHDGKFKAKVAIEAIQELKTMNELTSKFEVQRTQIQSWKKKCLDGIPSLFKKDGGSEDKKKDQLIKELYQKIGVLQVEMDWLKKKL